jgi:hypothetical protein
MIGFYKKNIDYITEAAVNPDKRRFSSAEEAPRHYIDLDHYGEHSSHHMPVFWDDAKAKYTEDTLKAYGIVPWHIYKVFFQLKDAFALRDPQKILRLSAELGHYVADAHVPLHTTENYNGQLTGQEGIHAFWESRLPELFSDHYDFFVGRAKYLKNVQVEIWKTVTAAHSAVDSVLREEKKLSEKFGEKRFSFETKGKQTQKVYSEEYSKAYHKILNGMVERQMQSAIAMVGSIWYTAWVDAGQPDLDKLIKVKPSKEELATRKAELQKWKENQVHSGE